MYVQRLPLMYLSRACRLCNAHLCIYVYVNVRVIANGN